MKRLLTLSFFIAVVFLTFKFSGPFFSKFDRVTPEIFINNEINGLGAEERNLHLTFKDAGSGLSNIRVIAEQNNQVVELYTKDFDEKLNEFETDLKISGKEGSLKEGTVNIKIETTDRSFFSNNATTVKNLSIDYAKPKIQVLTQQHRAKEGGVEFIMYRTQDSNLKETGVKVGDIRYPAAKGADIDAAFANEHDLYGALFAVPLASFGGDRKIAVYSNDSAGNEALVSVSIPIDSFKQAEASPKLSEQFINEKIDDLLPGYEKRSGQRVNIDRQSEKGLAEAFKIINEKYRLVLDNLLFDLMTKNPPSSFLWKGIFIKPMPSATSSTLGEKRHYMYNSTDAGNSVHCGLDLASVENDIVRAANDGTVALAEEFGIYGNAIVIDHGLGLYSLYGHLSSVGKNVGDMVQKADEIGRSGKTGLAGGDHLHFEFRLRGIPVTPIEWWDNKWMQDDFYGKIESVKNSLQH